MATQNYIIQAQVNSAKKPRESIVNVSNDDVSLSYESWHPVYVIKYVQPEKVRYYTNSTYICKTILKCVHCTLLLIHSASEHIKLRIKRFINVLHKYINNINLENTM